ncbi:7-cyano-7-deazaguanine synthase QueC [Parasphingorhabdus halotolerans]|uniref:7-cyano-7-deazaguanine synthase n=1 Tax=Parasphingorhabdus halotolerans TaxID=2725558 RepID=A0A6H2DKF9_9SPHN|nr:7-cyano-7-deazaguanine synthase QueC [Parasphingorhabdus halotolerans]QJB68473.1 7-cyano-7-deazaguanine synthase QueC [Parasphingorhabdus halotolerans]
MESTNQVTPTKTAIVLLSGGMDSMVSGALAREQGYKIIALTIDYNQRHKIELQSAVQIAAKLDVAEHIVLPLDLSRFGGSALTDNIDVPKSGVTNEIPVTYVPARNLIFLSLTLGLAEARDARDIFIGVNALDYSGYPDCRPEFIEGFERLADLATKAGDEGSGFTIQTPLQYMTKADIAKVAVRLDIDPALSWSCYDPAEGNLHCGYCDSCRLRQKGFEEAGIADPTRYAAKS